MTKKTKEPRKHKKLQVSEIATLKNKIAILKDHIKNIVFELRESEKTNAKLVKELIKCKKIAQGLIADVSNHAENTWLWRSAMQTEQDLNNIKYTPEE